MLCRTLVAIEDGTMFTAACFAVRIIEALAFAALNTGIFATMGRLYPESLGSAMVANHSTMRQLYVMWKKPKERIMSFRQLLRYQLELAREWGLQLEVQRTQ